jgi:hypothetical protein
MNPTAHRQLTSLLHRAAQGMMGVRRRAQKGRGGALSTIRDGVKKRLTIG